MIHLSNVRKIYNQGKSSEYKAIDGIDLEIRTGRLTALKGPSGSGKTTLLSMIGCMARPTSGRIQVHEREVSSLPERFLTEIRRNTFGFMFQQFNLIKGMSTLDNVMIPAFPIGEKRANLQGRAMELLDMFNLSTKASSRVEWLSGGEAQRVTIARAMINNPTILIADEPTAHLDTRLSVEFMDIMQRLKERGMTIIIASHDPLVHDPDTIDDAVEMRDGKIIPAAGD